MKTKLLALSLLMGAMSLPLAAQVKVSVSASKQPVGTVLEQIKQSSGYEIFYNDDHVKNLKPVTIKANNEDIKKVLDKVFAGTGISYTIRDKQVIITTKDKGKSTTDEKPAKKKDEPKKSTSPRTVTGTVTGTDGEPLIGATVREKGTNNATVTDFNGEFSLKTQNPNATLEFSYVGYKNTSIKAGSDKTVSIEMQENSEVLDELVVVGYGAVKKSDLTGSVSQIKVNETTAATVSSVTNALAGKAAGLQVSLNTAQPGSASTIRIRGAASPNCDNSPLIVIDGFPVNPTSDSKTAVGKYYSGSNDNFLGSINPNDIESIEVLKDASSTAIYGARAGHGVILITTKKGKAGKATVTYSGNASVQTIAKSYEMLDSRSFMIETERYRKEKWRIDNYVGMFGGED